MMYGVIVPIMMECGDEQEIMQAITGEQMKITQQIDNDHVHQVIMCQVHESGDY